jgi:hypothetical protein
MSASLLIFLQAFVCFGAAAFSAASGRRPATAILLVCGAIALVVCAVAFRYESAGHPADHAEQRCKPARLT